MNPAFPAFSGVLKPRGEFPQRVPGGFTDWGTERRETPETPEPRSWSPDEGGPVLPSRCALGSLASLGRERPVPTSDHMTTTAIGACSALRAPHGRAVCSGVSRLRRGVGPGSGMGFGAGVVGLSTSTFPPSLARSSAIVDRATPSASAIRCCVQRCSASSPESPEPPESPAPCSASRARAGRPHQRWWQSVRGGRPLPSAQREGAERSEGRAGARGRESGRRRGPCP